MARMLGRGDPPSGGFDAGQRGAAPEVSFFETYIRDEPLEVEGEWTSVKSRM
jgi:hypothetical protein